MPEADAAVRADIAAEAANEGWPAMHDALRNVDPLAASRIRPTDAQRIQRAIEIWRLTGRSLSDWQADAPRRVFPFRVLRIVISPSSRATLHQRIEARFAAMLDAGLIDEVERLRRDDRLHADLPSMRAVGYRQVWQYLDGNGDRAQLFERGVAATRQLAKRQLTWLRSQLSARWFDPQTQRREIERALALFVSTRT